MRDRLLSSAAITSLLALPAAAAPINKASPAIVADPWTGYYVGAYLGGAWGSSDAATSIPCTATAAPPGYFCTTTGGGPNAAAVAASGSGSLSASGFTGGIQAGYNRQINNIVVGLEADFGAFNLNASRAASASYPVGGGAVTPANAFTIGSSIDTDWLFTFRGRVGWASSNWLVYGTGGLALTDLKVTSTFSDNNGASTSGSTSDIKLGWTIGAGVEWVLSRQWTVKGEYLYVDFGSVTANSLITTGAIAGYAQAISTDSDLTAHIARVGVNYRF